MKPYQAGGGPGDVKIRELVAAGASASSIATEYGVRRQSAEHWIRRAGVTVANARLRHHEYLPWRLNPRDSWDGVARALRSWSADAQGAVVGRDMQYQMKTLREYLAEHDLVVDYDYDSGFRLVPRDPEVDDPTLPIRRPK